MGVAWLDDRQDGSVATPRKREGKKSRISRNTLSLTKARVEGGAGRSGEGEAGKGVIDE